MNTIPTSPSSHGPEPRHHPALRAAACGLAWLAATAGAGPLEDLQPGHWYEVPDSRLEDVGPVPVPEGSTGVKSVVFSWSSAVYDTRRDRFVVWGGGHTNYSGNEVYAFDVATLKWERLTDPSSLDGWTDGDKVYADGRPVSRHTYNYIEYIPPPYDRLFSGGGAGLWRGAWGDDKTYYFDFDQREWETLPVLTPNPGIGAISGWDPVTEKIWFHNAGKSTYLSSFDPATRTWTTHGNWATEPDGWIGYDWTGAVDPVRRKFVAIGNGQVYVWDLTQTGNIANTKLQTTGDTWILDQQCPGFVYDPNLDRFVAWSGGTDVFTLDMDSATWTRVPPAQTNTVVPTEASPSGTYGRFRYIPSRGLYIALNGADQNVYFYRLSATVSQPPSQPATPTAQVVTP